MKKKLLILLALTVLLTACLPSQQTTQSSDVDLESRVNTAVAGTMESNQRIEQAVQETVAAQSGAGNGDTSTDVTTNNVSLLLTPTLVPTETPFAFASSTPTASPVPLKYTCAVYKKKPKDNEVFNKNEKFDVKFTVMNTGTRTWPKGIDFKYVSGTVLAGPKRVEIPKALAPGQSYEIVLDGKAPDTKGFYVMTYFVDGPMCYGYIAINVK